MATILERPVMAKQRGRPKTMDRDEGSVRLDRTLIRRAKAIADYRNISVADLLGEIVAAPLDKAYAQMLRGLEEGTKGKGAKE